MAADDISKLVEFANCLVYEKTGKQLETVEKDILRQTLIGKKLSAIQCPSYENSYVQRFRAPKLWSLLSVVLGEKVSKKTVLEVLQRLQSQQYVPTEHANASLDLGLRRSQLETTQSQSSTNIQPELNGHASLNGSMSCPELRNGETTEADYHESKKVEDCSTDSTAKESQSPSQAPQSGNSDETKSSTDGLPTFMNFMKPGVPLLLSIGLLSSLFAFSWLANWYGVTNHLVGQLPKAHFGYSWALKLNPASAAARYNQGVAYEDQHNYERAHAKYQLAIEGGLIEAYNNQARLYILEGNYDAAVSLLRIGLPLAKDARVRADMYKNRGWARLEQGRHDEAKVDLTEAIKLKSDRAPSYCLLAQVLERQGDEKGALLEWENCLGFAYQPNTPEEDKWVHLASQRLDPKGDQK